MFESSVNSDSTKVANYYLITCIFSYLRIKIEFKNQMRKISHPIHIYIIFKLTQNLGRYSCVLVFNNT